MKKRFTALMLALILVLMAPTALTGFAEGTESTGVKITKIKTASAPKEGIKVGEEFLISDLVTVQPEGASKDNLVYKSSDESIAVVNEGAWLMGKAPGKVTITITDPETKKAAKLNLIIVRPVSGIQVTPGGNLDIFTGERVKLTAEVLPEDASNKKVVWSSKDEGVAKVNNGTVTGVAPGRTFIHCTAADGSYTDATIMVTVARPLRKITFAAKSYTVTENNEIQLTCYTEPIDATDRSLDWVSSDEKVARVSSSGTVYGRNPGKATITVTARDGSGKKASTTVYVEPADDSAFSIDYLWWEVNSYGIMTGRIKLDIMNYCVKRRIRIMNFTINTYDINDSLIATTYSGVVTSVPPGRRITTKWLPDYIKGLNNATKRLELKVDAVTYDDGTFISYPYGKEIIGNFVLR